MSIEGTLEAPFEDIMKAGLYIHIPFCASRCIYCGFYSTVRPDLQDRYVSALCREMDLWQARETDGSSKLMTIYLGGGTPSQLSAANLERLFQHIYKVYDVAPDAEVTMECNPDDISRHMFDQLPVNRVSMGAQTFDDDRLRFLHRRHTAREVERAMEFLRTDGIDNISIDLMFGFPGESLCDWEGDICHALTLMPEHLSAYGLMIEEGTPLHRLWKRGDVQEANENLSLKMYDRLIDQLTEAGYEHYEISNFALLAPGDKEKSRYRSRHNSSYWRDVPYIGLGAAAHSYDLRARRWNPSDIMCYMEQVEQGLLPYEEETIDCDTHYNDIVTTALRTREGIDLDSLDDRHRTFLLSNAKEHIDRKLLRADDHHLSLTRAGINISNTIMCDLMDV